jgi:hypothetical protein
LQAAKEVLDRANKSFNGSLILLAAVIDKDERVKIEVMA